MLAQDPGADGGFHGRRLADWFGAEDAPEIVSRSLGGAQFALTEVAVAPLGRFSDPFPQDEAFHLSLVLRDLPDHRYWEDGRMAPARLIAKGQVQLHDARRSPYTLIDKPLHSLLFYMPRRTLSALADEDDIPRIEELVYEPGAGLDDEVIRHLGAAVLPAVRAPEQANRLFTDHVMLALAAHVTQTYGAIQVAARPVVGGLARWQERRAKDLLAADLTGTVSIAEVAQACGLSAGHFARAFRRSAGLAPHSWLQHRRVEAAKAMLRRRDLPLTEIALACGFAHQAHFTRVFTQIAGLSPGAWRRNLEA